MSDVARLRREGLRPFATLAAELGCDRRRLNEWVRAGKGGVRLEAVKMHNGWHTSDAAVNRFLAAVSEAGRADAPAPSPTRGERERDRFLADMAAGRI